MVGKVAENNLLVFSGANRRYKYIVNKILDKYPNTSLIVQKNVKGHYRGKFDNDKKFDKESVNLLNRHLEMRDKIEAQYYVENEFHINEDNKVLYVTSQTLNSTKVANFIKKVKPDIALSFGISLLKKKTLNILKDFTAINLHLGLSPYYRSSDTLLWPLYLQNPGHIGITLHKIDHTVDNGPIYYQQKTVFNKEDSIHDIFCKTIIQATDPTLKLVDSLMRNARLKTYKSSSKGKKFLNGEFTPDHLKIIYLLIEEGMLEKYLKGMGHSKDLRLYNCFKE